MSSGVAEGTVLGSRALRECDGKSFVIVDSDGVSGAPNLLYFMTGIQLFVFTHFFGLGVFLTKLDSVITVETLVSFTELSRTSEESRRGLGGRESH